jgi:hypothetical protein
MSEGNPIDAIFRDQLHDHSMEPPMHLWGALEARRAAQVKQENRRKLGFWLLSAALLLCISGAILIWLTQKPTDSAGHTTPAPTQSDAPVAQIHKSPSNGVEHNADLTEVETSSAANLSLKNPGSKAELLADQKIALAKNKVTKPENNASGFQPRSKSAQTFANNAVSTQEQPAASLVSDKTAASTHADQSTANQVMSSATNDTESPVVTEAAEHLTDFSSIDSKAYAVVYEPSLGLDGGRPLTSPLPKGWRVYGELFGAVDVPTRTLDAREPEFESYRQAREQSETVQTGQRMALRFSMISVDGIAVRSGLSYGIHRETFDYQQVKQKNRFQTIDIPVVLGYERNNVGKFTLSANAGVYVNMAFNQHGSFLSPDLNKVLEFSSNKPDAYPAFRNHLGLSWYGSVAASYPITPRLRLVIEPYVLRNSGSFTANDYAIDQRYQNWGINIGIRKKINKYIYFVKP